MSRHVKAGGVLKEPTQRYIKVGGVMRTVIERYKKVSGVMQEVWPLVPGPVSNLQHNFVYRNDRIELDVSWTAPTTGAPVTNYNVNVHISGHTFNYFDVGTATTFTWALSPSGSGWQSFAGYNVQIILTPQAAGNRSGPQTTNAFKVVPQLPAPDNVPSLSIDVQNYTLYQSWTNMTGNRVTGYEIHVYLDGTFRGSATYSKGTASAAYTPWDPNTVAGGNVAVYIRATGPGGSSPSWTSQSGQLPSMPSIGGTRFWSGGADSLGHPGGRMIADVSAPTGCNVWWQNVSAGGAWNYMGVHNNGRIALYGSEGWGRDNSTYYRFIYQPVRGSWTGRTVGGNWALKIPNPHKLWPTDSSTWYPGVGWFLSTVKQGTEGGSGRYGYYFYGNQFQDQFSPNRTGYGVNCYHAEILMSRYEGGPGPGGAVPLHMWLHVESNRPGYLPNPAGNVYIGSLDRGAGGWIGLPSGWPNQLRDGWYRGTAFQSTDEATNPGLNTSNSYAEFRGYDVFFGDTPFGTVQFYHDG